MKNKNKGRKRRPLSNSDIHRANQEKEKDIEGIEYVLTDVFYTLETKDEIDDIRYQLINIVNDLADDYIEMLR